MSTAVEQTSRAPPPADGRRCSRVSRSEGAPVGRAGMIAGTGSTAVYIGWFKVFAWSGPEAWWFGISPEGIGTLGMLINFGVTWVVSRRTGSLPADSARMVAMLRGS